MDCLHWLRNTVEPLNKGPIGMSRYVTYLEVSFRGRLNNNCLIIIILTRICACMYNFVRVYSYNNLLENSVCAFTHACCELASYNYVGMVHAHA